MSSAIPMPWSTLPTEMKLSIVELLDSTDVRSVSKVNKEAYTLAVPAMWRAVELNSLEKIRAYINNVPTSYHRYTRQLTICTKSLEDRPYAPSPHSREQVTEDCFQLLSQCTQLEQLTLSLTGSLGPEVIPCFSNFHSLRVLSINHCGDEQHSPLSERFVVSAAASVPNLRELSLDRITRSEMHAPELVGVYPFVPVVTGDGGIPRHPLLGDDLSLPSLLRLPTLKKLRIRDTHLGDPNWAVTPICCSLEFLDLGSCYHETEDFNRMCTERIVGKVGHSVDEFSLNTAITNESYAFEKPKETPLKKLRKIHLTPLFPVENVVDTLTSLSGSPVEELCVRCHEDDVTDVCSALEDFLSKRVEHAESDFYKHLAHINISTVTDIYDEKDTDLNGQSFRGSVDIPPEPAAAIERVQEFFQDIRGAKSCGTTCEFGPLGSGKVAKPW